MIRVIFLLAGILALTLLLLTGCSGSQAEKSDTKSRDKALKNQTSPASSAPQQQARQTTPPPQPAVIPSNPAEEGERFVLTDINGETRRWSEFEGNPLIINFWATWCGPCRVEMPILKELYAEYQSKGLEIISISVDQNPAPVKPWVQQMNIPWTVTYLDMNAVKEFRLGQSIPCTIFLDKDGNEESRLTGAHPKETMRDHIEQII